MSGFEAMYVKRLLAGKAPLTALLHTNMQPYCLLCCTGLSIVLPHYYAVHNSTNRVPTVLQRSEHWVASLLSCTKMHKYAVSSIAQD